MNAKCAESLKGPKVMDIANRVMRQTIESRQPTAFAGLFYRMMMRSAGRPVQIALTKLGIGKTTIILAWAVR
jgi:hypothetical protein